MDVRSVSHHLSFSFNLFIITIFFLFPFLSFYCPLVRCTAKLYRCFPQRAPARLSLKCTSRLDQKEEKKITRQNNKSRRTNARSSGDGPQRQPRQTQPPQPQPQPQRQPRAQLSPLALAPRLAQAQAQAQPQQIRGEEAQRPLQGQKKVRGRIRSAVLTRCASLSARISAWNRAVFRGEGMQVLTQRLVRGRAQKRLARARRGARGRPGEDRGERF